MAASYHPYVDFSGISLPRNSDQVIAVEDRHHVESPQSFLCVLSSSAVERSIPRSLYCLTVILIGLPRSSDTLTTDVLKVLSCRLQRQRHTKFCQHFSRHSALCTVSPNSRGRTTHTTHQHNLETCSIFNKGHLFPITMRSPSCMTPSN